MERLALALFVFLLVLFIGNVVYKETFTDCNAPGQMTWTISLGPGSSSCSSSNSSPNRDGQDSGEPSEDSSESGESAGTSTNTPKESTSTSNSHKSSSNSSKKDASGNNPLSNSSSMINLSLTDILALVGSSSSGSRTPAYNYHYASMSVPQPPAPNVYITPGLPAPSLNSQFTDLRTSALDPVMNEGSYADFQDNRIPSGSYATRQGVQYIRGVPASNPVAEQPAENPEYIRKDSIPCYACSL